MSKSKSDEPEEPKTPEDSEPSKEKKIADINIKEEPNSTAQSTSNSPPISSSTRKSRNGKRSRMTLSQGNSVPVKKQKVSHTESMDVADQDPDDDQPKLSATPEKKFAELLEPIIHLRTQLDTILAKHCPKGTISSGSGLPALSTPAANIVPSSSRPKDETVWGKLFPQTPGQPPISLYGSPFTIGRNSRSNLVLRDPLVGDSLCRIHNVDGRAFIEGVSNTSMLTLNQRAVKKHLMQLRSGDELLIVGSNQTYHYLFAKVTDDVSKKSLTPLPIHPVFSLPAISLQHSVPLSPTNTLSQPSTATTTATVSTTTVTTTSSTTTVSPVTSVTQSASATPNTTSAGSPTAPIATASFTSPPSSPPPSFSTPSSPPHSFSTTTPCSPKTPLNNEEFPHFQSERNGAFSPFSTNTPHTTASRAPPTLNYPAVESEKGEAPVETLTFDAKRSYLEKVEKLLKSPIDITTSFDNFPYHLDDNIKRLLINSMFVYLEKPEFVKYTKAIPTMSRNILLTGDKGTQILQEKLVESLVKHFNSKYLIIDDCFSDVAAKESEHTDGRINHLLLDEYGTGFTSSVHPIEVQATQRYTFKKGDKVKFIGPPSAVSSGSHALVSASATFSSSLGAGLVRYAPRVSFEDNRKHSTPGHTSSRGTGPVVGQTGKVIITFDDNPSRVGVSFDKPFPGGINLGTGDENHGFFVYSNELKYENDAASEENSNAFIMEAIFEVLKKESNQPCIVFLKNFEKSFVGNMERLTLLKRELERVESRTVFIASSAPASSRSDKSDRPGVIFKSGSHTATALLDLSLFDHMSRFEDRKDSSKVSKVLSKLFPCKISVHKPKSQLQLSEWQKQIDKDKEQMKSEANLDTIRKVLAKNNVLCLDLDRITFNSKKVLSRSQVEKVVGWAVAHHVMTLSTPEKSKLAIEPPQSPSLSNLVPVGTDVEPDADVLILLNNDVNTPSTITTTTVTTSATTTVTATNPVPDQANYASTSKSSRKSLNEKATPLLNISLASIAYAMHLLNVSNPPKNKSVYDVETDNEFEKRLLSDVIPPHEIELGFDNIGALDKVKETLKELVMLPLQRPELFRKGNLTKPCKGILLFGPPGTGKTMLAKAVATESGANFISISMASIGSKWFGEGEKYARAVFTLASKIAPCVIFIDEVDSILGRREKHGEHEAMRKIKNEFMMMWDGLRTRVGERVLVLAATNRPFDLDDAVLRRLPRRLLVDLPDVENRLKILRLILKDEDIDTSVDLVELAKMTEGFSGSDLHNLCVAAAYQPIREFLQTEKQENKDPQLSIQSSRTQENMDLNSLMEIDKLDPLSSSFSISEITSGISNGVPATSTSTTTQAVTTQPKLRSLRMSDFEKAKKEVSASVSEDAQSIGELRKWNEMYGEGGSRRKTTLSYYV